MTPEEAVAEEERLLAEVRSATVAVDEHRAAKRDLDRRYVDLTKQRIATFEKRARGTSDDADDLDAIEDDLAEVAAGLARVEDAVKGSERGRQAAEQELNRHRADELPALAEAAEVFTAEATEALAALAEPYLRAVETWDRARARWSPYAPAIREQIREAREADGLYASGRGDDEASRVGEFPLPAPGFVFERLQSGALAARPPALRATHPEPRPTAA